MLDLWLSRAESGKRGGKVGGSELQTIKSKAVPFTGFHARQRRFQRLIAFNALLSGMLCDCQSRTPLQLSPTIPERFTNFLPGFQRNRQCSDSAAHFTLFRHRSSPLPATSPETFVYICHAWSERSLITFFRMRITYVSRTTGQSDRENVFDANSITSKVLNLNESKHNRV